MPGGERSTAPVTKPSNRRDLLPSGGEGVLQDEDDGVSAEEHLGDEAVLVDWLGFLLAYHENMGLDFQPLINLFYWVAST